MARRKKTRKVCKETQTAAPGKPVTVFSFIEVTFSDRSYQIPATLAATSYAQANKITLDEAMCQPDEVIEFISNNKNWFDFQPYAVMQFKPLCNPSTEWKKASKRAG